MNLRYGASVPSVFLGLGSNIDPEKNLTEAAKKLRAAWPDIRFSSVYRSAATEVTEQPDFLNAVARFETEQSPEEIIRVLQKMEQSLGKDPPYRFGPRTIDLDLLLYGDAVIDDPTMIIPHPRMHQRRFVLDPLSELLDPDTLHPRIQRSWKMLRKDVEKQHCAPASLHLEQNS